MATMTTLLDTTTADGPIYRHGNSDILPVWSQREAAAAEQPWTATRCHRQLRPLLTHLMALRGEKARAALKRRNESLRQCPSPGKRTTADDDRTGRKRVRYTYSLKGRRRQGRPASEHTEQAERQEGEPTQKTKVAPLMQQATRSFCPGEVVVATPVLSRALKHRQAWSLPSSPLIHREPEPVGEASVPTEEHQDAPRHKLKDTCFKYRGYYQNSLRIGAGSAAKPWSKPGMDADWAALFRATSPESRQMYEAIFRAVEALLRATTSTTKPAQKKAGANSLLAMCLRKVPQYVAACEEAEREEAEKQGAAKPPSSSVSLDVYSDLESLGGGDRGGWKHLRTVVRQHGVDILTAACAEGLLHDSFVRLLVRLCTHMKAYDEAESLTAALFDRHVSSVPRGQSLYKTPEAGSTLTESTGTMASLSMLLHYADETGRTSVPLRQITDLVSHGHLPSAWLSTPAFGGLWHRTVRLLSSRGSPACDEDILLDFTTAAVTQFILSRPDDDILHPHSRESRHGTSGRTFSSTFSSHTSSSSYHTLTSILGSICAVGLLQKEAVIESGGNLPSSEPAVRKRLSVITQQALLDVSRTLKRRKGQHKVEAAAHYLPRQYLLLLAARLVQSTSGLDDSHRTGAVLEQLVEEASAVQKGQVYDATISLVTSVAENCGRASTSAVSGVPASRSYLLELCTQAASYMHGVLGYASESSLATQLQADAAFLLASRSNDLRDLAFAESFGKGTVRTTSQRPTSGPRTELASASATDGTPLSPRSLKRAAPVTALFEGYRWEEGISEWVIATPIPTSRPRPAQSPLLKRRRSELVVVLDDVLPVEEDSLDNTRPLRSRGRLSLPASFSPSSPTTGDDTDMDLALASRNDRNDRNNRNNRNSNTTTPLLPRTPTSSVRSRLRNVRRQRSTRRLLHFVSDSEGDADDHDETGSCLHGRNEMPRLPLFDLGNAKNISRSSAPGNAQQKKEMAAYDANYANAATSDDELGL